MESWCTPPGSASGTSAASPPDAGTVFRIASMSKKLHRVRGPGAARRRDAQARRPGRGVRPRAASAGPPVTPDVGPRVGPAPAHHDGRFPDRLLVGGPAAGPAAGGSSACFLSGGVRFNWAPGTQFEYSNLGYAILGRVYIAAVTGQRYPDYVPPRPCCARLGMTRTGFEAEEFEAPGPPGAAAGGLAQGYRAAGQGGRRGGPAIGGVVRGGLLNCSVRSPRPGGGDSSGLRDLAAGSPGPRPRSRPAEPREATTVNGAHPLPPAPAGKCSSRRP